MSHARMACIPAAFLSDPLLINPPQSPIPLGLEWPVGSAVSGGCACAGEHICAVLWSDPEAGPG